MWTQGKVVKRIDWNNELFSLFIDADIGDFTAGQFVKLGLDLDEKRVGRAYSLVNAPESDLLEVLLISVEDGLLSPALHQLQPGDTLHVSAKASGFMTLDWVPEARDLWMLATGTAVGPFISMLRTEAPWQRFEHIVLVYGVRFARDLAYNEELQALSTEKDSRFSYLTSITRESLQDTLNYRIPQALEKGQLEQCAGIAITPEHSHVMLCGNPAMIADTQTLLMEKGLKKNLKRNPGHISMERYW
ncbi:ferredoxin--NADP reductase [Lacimicrobium alkaliphilum]|uniref:ferredoxin--NADP(+) reductase n=1 Tax=Lacimicrobium alkaliphilum TaxID=1526571 RepID=A0A0U2QLD6_9ALTE|nr:ferredoxin--NADP reductase [Lacimicrobium alkaliphilum]ALS98139.1 ferredoxin--NADP(+) reductase [Lacimicrobium alkaliphilum]